MSFAKRCQLQEPFLGQGELFLLLVTSGPSVCSSLNQSMGPNNYIQQVFPRPAQSHSRVTLRNKRTAICDLAAPAGSLECSTSKFLPLVQRKFLGCPAPATFPSCWLLAPSSLIDTQRTLCPGAALQPLLPPREAIWFHLKCFSLVHSVFICCFKVERRKLCLGAHYHNKPIYAFFAAY